MGILQKLFGLGNGTSYFLNDDDAKTYGDIDYMRKEITVERTYPKGKADDIPVDKYVPPALNKSAKPVTKTSYGAKVPYRSQEQSFIPSTPTSSFAPQPQSFAPQPSEPQPTSQASQPPAQESPKPSFTPPETKKGSKSSGGDGMDMFRSMAKIIRR